MLKRRSNSLRLSPSVVDCRVTHTTSSFFVFQGYKPAKLGYIVSKADLSRVEGTEVRFEMNLSGLEWFGEKEARFWSLLGVFASFIFNKVQKTCENEL